MSLKAPRLPARLWHGQVRGARLALCMCLTVATPVAAADIILAARYSEPTTRYPHGVLGDRIEYAALELTVEHSAAQSTDTNKAQSLLTIRLPSDRVFEDLTPRLWDIDQDGAPEVIVVESQENTGAQLAIYNARGEKIAATPHIGTRFRWLAPIGAADLDGDGYVEIAYIDRPHLAKTLRIWRFHDGKLTEIAALSGLTNHKIGEDFISGGIRDCGTGPELVVASADWGTIVSVAYENGWQTTNLGPLKRRSDLTQAIDC